MRIKSVECEQFAGLQGSELKFDNGLNLVVGENESGKSTMADLIYQILFKDVKLDGRRDNEFIDKYFPKKVNGTNGDVIDGILVFETPDGTYKLRKEWENRKGSCRLTLPDGTLIKDSEEINRILEGELKHRSGVYSEIVFPSQKREQNAIESIMKTLGKKADSLSDTREALTSTLTQAALETGGVSLEKIEKSLVAHIDGLTGRWDLKADAPEGGAKRAYYENAWGSGAGTIVKAYYAADEVRSCLCEAEEAEIKVEVEKAKLQNIKMQKKDIEAEKSEFQKFRTILVQKSLLSKTIAEAKTKIREQKEVISRWPKLEMENKEAKELKEKKEQAEIRKLYLKAHAAQENYLAQKEEFDKLTPVDEADIVSLRNMTFKVEQEKSKLAGMNITAKVKPLGAASVDVCYTSTGVKLSEINGEYDITEAVDICVPGVMEMSLIPKGVDLDRVKSAIREAEDGIKVFHEKYNVSSLEELQKQADIYRDKKQKVDSLELELKKIIGDKGWEELAAENKNVPDTIESVQEIELKINRLCGSASIDKFIGGNEALLSGYVSKYVSMEELQKSVKNLEEEKENSEKQLDSLDNVPEKFADIKNPEAYAAQLQDEIDDCETNLDKHNDLLREAERKLGEKSAEEYLEELQQKEAELEARKTEYVHWKNIYDVFLRLKEKTAGNPIEDIEEKFREYLELISEGGLKLNSIDEQLSVKLASGNHELTYDILSDGTKDTIGLAFRLAMLEHLYPEGDGLAVFDDPFTDMDSRRVEEACKLVQKFAENNQVIFITCDEKYQKFLQGNVIQLMK